MEPLTPRITKSTATAAIRARFPKESDLLKRFEVAKAQANLWDGERDGLREAVKQLEAGQYDNVILAWTQGAAVLYPNADGKHQLESCLQTTIPAKGHAGPVSAYSTDLTPHEFLDRILTLTAKGKEYAVAFLDELYLGTGEIVQNQDLYEKKASERSNVTIIV